jgi:hypothetical protein
LSARHKIYAAMNDRLCKLCVALAREDRSYYRTVDELLADARGLLRAGDAARAALEAKRSPKAAYAKAAKHAEPYGARVVEGNDLSGTVLGLKFSSGHYLSGFDNVYRIA